MSDQEPKHISESLPVSSDEIEFIGDPSRAYQVHDMDLTHEIRGLEEDREAIIEMIQSGQDTPELRTRLQAINQSLLSAQSDLNLHRQNPSGNP